MDIEWMVFIWLAGNATVGYVIGSQRGYPITGLIFGLMLGPIGWLWVAFGSNFSTYQPPEEGGIFHSRTFLGLVWLLLIVGLIAYKMSK